MSKTPEREPEEAAEHRRGSEIDEALSTGAAPSGSKGGGDPSPTFGRLSAILVPILIVAAIAFFLGFVHQHYPIQHWLFWRYAGYWAAALSFGVACTSMGLATIRWVLRRSLPVLEHLSIAFALGVFEFFLLMNALGHLQLYRGPTFFALPLAMLAISFRGSWPWTRRLFRHLRHARSRSARPQKPWWWWPAVLYGIYGCLLVYILILTPDNVQFDSRWKHLALAEEHAVYGGLRRFPEGWTVATYPHLATYLYGWSFLFPFGRLFDHVEMACHIEFLLFLASVASIPALVRLLVPGARGHLSWIVRFLFPGIFLYDSSLSAGADHVGAFFAIPAFAMLIRFYRQLDYRYAILMSVPLAGVALSKYTATAMVVPFFGLAVVFRAAFGLYGLVRKSGPVALRQNFIVGPLTSFATLVVATAPHWVKNWIWYGDPSYPTLYKSLKLRPWTVDGADVFEWGYKDYQFWRPTHDLDGVVKTLGAMFSFSFVPNDYGRYHGKVPTFGSVFTLLLVTVPFLKGKARLLALIASIHTTIFIWYWTHHQDRYLQVILPWISAATAAMLVKLYAAPKAGGALATWSSKLTRTLVGALLVAQAVWGADVWFYPTHAMSQSPQKRVLDLIAQGSHKKDYEGRFKIYSQWTNVAKLLPKDARVLLHDNHVHLGIHASTVNDWVGWQYGISYVRLGDPARIYQEMKEPLGVTHFVWENQRSAGWDTVGGDLLFFEFIHRHTSGKKQAGSTFVSELQATPPNLEGRNDQVAMLVCDKSFYKNGLYQVTDLTTPVFGPNRKRFAKPRKTEKNENALLEAAGFAVVDPSCSKQKGLPALKDFQLVAHRKRLLGPKGKKKLDLYLRKVGKEAPKTKEAPSRPQSDDDDLDPSHLDREAEPEDPEGADGSPEEEGTP